MAYYMQGDYYRGDYYRGDPFLPAVIGGLVARGAKALVKRRPAVPVPIPLPFGGGGGGRPGQKPTPGIRGRLQRLIPGGKSGYFKTRRMNPANPRALRRALRRVSGFGKLAARAKRDIARAAAAIGVHRRTSGSSRFVTVNPTSARVKVS